MAVLSITAASVIPGSNAILSRVTLGATITQGQPVYKLASDGEHYLADADSTEAVAAAVGICCSAGADGQPGVIQTYGDIDLGATLIIGETYVVSSTAGSIEPIGDMSSNDFKTVLGTARTAAILELKLDVTGTQVA